MKKLKSIKQLLKKKKPSGGSGGWLAATMGSRW